MPRPFKFEDIKHLLPPEKRKELEARPQAAKRSHRRGKNPSKTPVPATFRGRFRLRKCPWCKTEFMAPRSVRCPIECKGSRKP